MRKEFRFRHPKGRNIEVMYSFRPGKWKSTGCKNIADAVQFAIKDISAMRLGFTREKENTTLKEFAKDFFTEKDPHGFRKRLIRRGVNYEDSFYIQHQSRLDNYILPKHGDYLISAITDVMIEDFIIDLKKYNDKKTELANNTKNKVLICYRLVLQEAVRQGYVTKNAAKEVPELRKDGAERGVFTEDELLLLFPEPYDELLRIWGSLRWAVYFLILRDTGWRPGEVSSLRLSNYFPELQGVYTRSSVDFKTHQIKNRIKTSTKGQKYKDGFLQSGTVEVLRKYITTLEGDDPYFFEYEHKNKKQFIYPEVANKHFKASAERAGVRLHGRTQYCFRHTFNTYYIGRLPEAARLILMGHRAYRREYDHLTPEQSLQRVLSIQGTSEALGLK